MTEILRPFSCFLCDIADIKTPGKCQCSVINISYLAFLIVVLINEQCAEHRLGFAAVSVILFTLSGVWWGIMKTFRSRELDLWGQQQPVGTLS